MANKLEKLRTPHPLSGTRIENWGRLLLRYGCTIDASHFKSALKITSLSLMGTIPRVYETVRYSSKISHQKIDPPPIFIIGHWRSGTTNLHNLMLQDPDFGHVSLLHLATFNFYFTLKGLLTRYLQRKFPSKRPMDEIPIDLNAPTSEDSCMISLSDLTHYTGYFFPKDAEVVFRKTVLFENVNPRFILRWYRDYTRLLQKISYSEGGKRLVLKNPPNTARIRHLLKLFPEAKFIHIYRNPYIVYASTCQLMDRFLENFALQEYDPDKIHEFALVRYKLLMERFFQDKDLIPAQNLIEVRHEDLVKDQIGIMEEIYKRFDLPSFDRIRSQVQKHIESIADYRANKYFYDDSYIQKVRNTLGFVIDRWRYSPP